MLVEGLKYLTIGVLDALVVIVLLVNFGWTGLLVALPIFFLVPFFVHWLKNKWERRNALR